MARRVFSNKGISIVDPTNASALNVGTIANDRLPSDITVTTLIARQFNGPSTQARALPPTIQGVTLLDVDGMVLPAGTEGRLRITLSAPLAQANQTKVLIGNSQGNRPLLDIQVISSTEVQATLALDTPIGVYDITISLNGGNMLIAPNAFEIV